MKKIRTLLAAAAKAESQARIVYVATARARLEAKKKRIEEIAIVVAAQERELARIAGFAHA